MKWSENIAPYITLLANAAANIAAKAGVYRLFLDSTSGKLSVMAPDGSIVTAATDGKDGKDATNAVPEAPTDGQLYGRKDSEWSIVTSQSSGGSAWQQLINESGNNLANFTAASGNWFVNGNGQIEIDSNGNGNGNRLWHNTVIPTGVPCVLQVSILIPSAQASQADMRAYILFAGDGTNNPGSPGARLDTSNLQNNRVDLEQDSQSAITGVTNNWSFDVWHTLAVVFCGSQTSVYLDDALLFSHSVNYTGSRVGICAIDINVQFRNFNLYTLALPVV